jgi:hypothetical protein
MKNLFRPGELIVVVIVAAFFLYLLWAEPTCRDGFVSMIGIGNGWVCVAGYKP